MRIKIKNKYVEYIKDNLRGFILSTNSKDVLIKRNKEYYITTVIIEDTYRLKLGDIITVDEIDYQVNIIQQIDDMFYCIQEPITKTSQFIFPMLGYNSKLYDFNKNFYNAYLSDCYTFIYLVYKFSSDENYLVLEEQLTNHKGFREIIDPNPDTVVFKFEIPEKYWNDVNLIMKGKYRELTPKLKTNIYKFHNLNSTSRTYKTLYNSKKFRESIEEELDVIIPEDIDLISKPIIEHEIWQNQILCRNISVPAGIIN